MFFQKNVYFDKNVAFLIHEEEEININTKANE